MNTESSRRSGVPRALGTATRFGRTFFLVFLAASVGACDRAKTAPAAPPPPEVGVAHPVVRAVTEWDEYLGRLAAVETVEVRPRVSGYLQSIHFREGQTVKKGDLLFVIDPRPFQATLTVAEAEVASAQVRLDLAKNDAARAENLVKTRAISTEEFDTRNKAALEAQALLEAANARVEQARLDVEFTEVRSPIDGRTSNFFVTVGNLITGGSGGGEATLLTTIVSLDPIHCYFDASEQDYLKYTRLAASGERASSRDEANPVRIALADEADFVREGRMNFVDNRIDQQTGTMRGRAVIPNADHTLVPGLFVRVRLLGQTNPRAVLVPDVAIGTDQSNRIVYVIDKDNVARLRIVVPGRLDNGMRVIRAGLDGTETVVVEGVLRVRPGQPVRPELREAEPPVVSPAALTPAPRQGQPVLTGGGL